MLFTRVNTNNSSSNSWQKLLLILRLLLQVSVIQMTIPGGMCKKEAIYCFPYEKRRTSPDVSLTLMLLGINLTNAKRSEKPWKMTETLANGYSSEGIQRELSDEYPQDRVEMVFMNLCVIVLWTKVASVLEGLNLLLFPIDCHVGLACQGCVGVNGLMIYWGGGGGGGGWGCTWWGEGGVA